MNKTNWLSIARSALTFVGFFLIGHSFIGHTVDPTIWETIAGIVLGGVGIVLGIKDKTTGLEQVASFIRSSIIGLSGIGVAWGYLTAETGAAIGTFVTAVMTVILSQTTTASIKDIGNGKAAAEVDASGKPTGKLAPTNVPPSSVHTVMMKKAVMILCLAMLSGACSAQFFKPLPKPGGALKLGAATVPLVQNSFRPAVAVTALTSDGTQLAGGIGVGWQHNVWDDAAQAYNTQYSFSAIGFLGSTAGKATFTGGVVIGFLNFLTAGYGYDFTNKRSVLITGAQIHFN